MKKSRHKIEKTSFSCPFQIGRSLNLFVFPVKSTMFSYVWIGMHVLAKISVLVPGLANAYPWTAQNLLMPHPGTGKVGKFPTVTMGVGGGRSWMHLVLTDALFEDVFDLHCSSSKTDFLCDLYWYELCLLDKRKFCEIPSQQCSWEKGF